MQSDPGFATSLSDPQGSNAVLAAVRWLEGTMLGTVATTIAIIAVAAVGFAMLSGRMYWRRSATVVVGCFILFGAQSIAAGVMGPAGPSEMPSASAEQPISVAPAPSVQAVRPTQSDPYAGASVR